MPKPPMRHRDGFEGHTECGIPLTKPGLVYQPPDGSGDPATCKSCIRLITHYCSRCKTNVVCYREQFEVRPSSGEYPAGHPDATRLRIANFRFMCPTCHEMAEWGHYPGQRAQQRKQRAYQKQNRQKREEYAQNVNRDWQEEWQREKTLRAEFGVDTDACVFCDESLPEDVINRQWDRSIPESCRFSSGGWQRSEHGFIGFVYCPDHLAEGAELDATLTAMFRANAGEIAAGVRLRFNQQSQR